MILRSQANLAASFVAPWNEETRKSAAQLIEAVAGSGVQVLLKGFISRAVNPAASKRNSNRVKRSPKS